jgi:hypothetical protein
MPRHQLLAVVIVTATAAFAIGVAIERSDRHSESGEAHVEASESDGETSEEATPPAETDTLFGIDAESTPLVVLAVVVSLVLAAVAWVRPDVELALAVIAAAMLAFAALDVREVFHQADESNGGLALLAGAVAALHLGAAALAVSLSRA